MVSDHASNQLAQAAAAKAGAGIDLLPHFIGRADPDLYPCALDFAPPPRDLWLITRRKDRKDVSIRMVSEFLILVFEEEALLFADHRNLPTVWTPAKTPTV